MVTDKRSKAIAVVVAGLIGPATVLLTILMFPVFSYLGFLLFGWPLSFYLPLAIVYLLVQTFISGSTSKWLAAALALVNIVLFVILALHDLIFWLNWIR